MTTLAIIAKEPLPGKAKTRLHPAAATFGSGGAEPYASALRRPESALLFLPDTRAGSTSRRVTMDVSRWNADADAADRTLLLSVTGPLLDVGRGPGRMVRAAEDLGIMAEGIDVSPGGTEVRAAFVWFCPNPDDPRLGQLQLWETRDPIGLSLSGLATADVTYLVTSVARDQRPETTFAMESAGWHVTETWEFTSVHVLRYERD